MEGWLGERQIGRSGAQASDDVLGSMGGALQFAADELKGPVRRSFMAQTVAARGRGGQRWAEETLGWNRGTIRKGQEEIRTDVQTVDGFSERGRCKAEDIHPLLLDDIRAIADPISQADPTFRTTHLYIPLTATAVRQLLKDEHGYSDETLPSERTIRTKLNDLDYRPQKVAKSKPLKKIPETDAIFKQVHKLNRDADMTDGVLRLSLDAKAAIKVGSFSRRGRNRRHQEAIDHDFKPDMVLSLFGFHLPAHDNTYLYFSRSKITADFIVDAMESLWPTLEETYHPHTLVLNMDNGPENHSHRTQFIKRIVDFVDQHSITVKLGYYPPYHSKYNPIERVWGILENHWNGELLDSEEKILGLAGTMKWKGRRPQILTLQGEYATGATLSKSEMIAYESRISRVEGLDKWFVDIEPRVADETALMS